jgi:hypothetical protein
MSFVTDLSIEKKVPLNELQKKEAKEKLNKQYKEESKLVKGIFKNIEAPGAGVEFPFIKIPHDPIRYYRFEDNKEYEIPLYLAKHINVTCNEKAVETFKDLDNNPTSIPKIRTVPKRQRYQFLSSEYM